MQTAVRDGMITMDKSLEEVKSGKIDQVQQKQDIKVYFKLIVVVTIVAIVSAVGCQKVMDWRKDQ